MIVHAHTAQLYRSQGYKVTDEERAKFLEMLMSTSKKTVDDNSCCLRKNDYLCIKIHIQDKSMRSSNIIDIASECDLTEILAVQKEAFGEVAKALGKDTLPPLEQTLEEMQEEYQKGVILKCVSADGKIIGSVRGIESESGTCSVGKLIVSPECQNQGVGRMLMAELEKQFPACCNFILFTSPDTPNTVHLYSSLGYQIAEGNATGSLDMINMKKRKIE